MEPCTPSTHFKFRSTTSACPILLFLFSFLFFPITTRTEQLPQVSNLRLSISDNLYWKFVWDRPIVDEVLNCCLSYTIMIEHDGSPFAPEQLFKEETMAFSSNTNVNITAQVQTRLKVNCTKPMDPNNCTKQMDPNNCINQMDPSNCTKPMDPNNCTKQMDPNNCINQMDPSNCTKPMDPNNCTKQMDPNNCTKQMDPNNCINQMDPNNCTKPMDPNNCINQMDPNNCTKQMDPNNCTKQMDPNNCINQMDPNNCTKQMDPNNCTKQMDPNNCINQMDPNNCTKPMDPNNCIKLMDPSNWTQSAPWPLNEKEVTDFICFWWNEKDFTCTWKARKNRMYNLQFTNRSMSKPLECKPVEKSKCVSTNVSNNDYFACLNTTTLDGTTTQASCKLFHYYVAVKYGPVTNIMAKEHEDRIHLSWNCPLGLVSCSLDYQIEYSTDKEKSKTEMKNIEESTYYDLMYISPNTCYTFRIRVDSAHNVESEWSEPLECCVTKKGNMPISVGVIIGISLTLLIFAAMLWFAVFNWRGIKNKLFPNIPKPDKAIKDWLDHIATSNTESRSLKSNMISKQVVPECAIIEVIDIKKEPARTQYVSDYVQ